MAFFFTFNALQQKHALSFTFSRYPSTLNTHKFPYFPHFLTYIPPKRASEQQVPPVFDVKGLAIAPTLSVPEQKASAETINLREVKETEPGYSSLDSKSERGSRNSVKNNLTSLVEEKTGRRVSKKDESRRKFSGLKKRRDSSSGNSSDLDKVENKVSGSPKTSGNNSLLDSDKVENIDGSDQVRKERDKSAKKKKNDSPEVQLRVSLDMCSKKGDVLSAINLYDCARKEGVNMGQYHYTVLLYLCSSAAAGFVRPAKSGSGSRTLNVLDSFKEPTNPFEFGGKTENGDRDVSSDNDNGIALMSSSDLVQKLDSTDTENITQFSNGFVKDHGEVVDGIVLKSDANSSQEDCKILVSEDVKKYALQKGFEIYENMCMDKVPMNEATLTSVARMAMSMGDGDMAFEMVKQMKPLGINPRLRSYGPALCTFCNFGDVDKAFEVEKHMLEHGVYPEEPELEALLRVSVAAAKGDKVYYLLHRLRTSVRQVSPPTADAIISWFDSKEASRLGKRKWDQRSIKEVMENNGGGWHGQGWLGKGKWNVVHTTAGNDGICKSCGVRLALIDLDPAETENFAKSVASIAMKRERRSSFEKFQKWLDYYGPFEAVLDAANVGLFSQRRFMPSKVNAVVNGIRQKLPSKKFPLIILHNKRITGHKMDAPMNKALVEKWKNADALYTTPTGSNDDWYWLYAAIKCRSLIVTNDEMRDHTFQLLGNDFFPKWKERHHVHFSFSDAGPEFHMPPPCSVVIQESEKGHWHVPVVLGHDFESERTWLCITRSNPPSIRQDSATSEESKFAQNQKSARFSGTPEAAKKPQPLTHGNQEKLRENPQEIYRNIKDILSTSVSSHSSSVVSEIEKAELLGGCTIDFQI